MTKNSKHYYIELYKTENEAVIVYNDKATELYGTFANLNIIKDQI